jgi:hypothetical protein
MSASVSGKDRWRGREEAAPQVRTVEWFRVVRWQGRHARSRPSVARPPRRPPARIAFTAVTKRGVESWAGACGTATSRFAHCGRSKNTLHSAGPVERRRELRLPLCEKQRAERWGVCSWRLWYADALPPRRSERARECRRRRNCTVGDACVRADLYNFAASGCGSWNETQGNGFALETLLHPVRKSDSPLLGVPLLLQFSWFHVFVPGETDSSSWQSIRPVDSSAAPARRRDPSLAASRELG